MKRLKMVMFVTLLAALLLAACGGSETPAPATVDPAEVDAAVNATLTASAPQAAPTEAPVEPAPPPSGSAAPIALLPQPAEGQPSLTAAYNVNVRTGPGTNYPVIGMLVGGNKATLAGRNEDSTWYAIALTTSGVYGWVPAEYALVANAESVPVIPAPPVPPTVEFIPVQPTDQQVVALTDTYVRTGAGTTYPAYGIAPTGARGKLAGVSLDGGWYLVRLNPATVGKGFGWVSTSTTQAENVTNLPVIQTAPPPAPVTVPPPASGAPSATAAEYVNVRSGPGTNYPVLGVAAPGVTGEVAGKSQDGYWWQVKIPTTYSADGLAWVSADYVTTANTENVPVVAAPTPPPALPPETTSSSCVLVGQNPVDGTNFAPGTDFDGTWNVQNLGSDTWKVGETDLKLVGAGETGRLSSVDVYDVASDVPPGAVYTAVVDMMAPSAAGSYGEAWSIVVGNQVLCQFYVIINVVP